MHDEHRAQVLQSELDRFIRIVCEQMQPERVVLFGSLAHGRVHEWSDLDLVVIADTDLPFLERLRQVVRRVCPKVTMDLFVYTPAEWVLLKQSRPFIRDEVDAKGKVVYERPGAAVG